MWTGPIPEGRKRKETRVSPEHLRAEYDFAEYDFGYTSHRWSDQE